MDFWPISSFSPLQPLNDPIAEAVGLRLFVKRDDLLHPYISGNKWRKLKYNLVEAKRVGCDTLITFGGAYSNHLYAVAAAGKEFGFKTMGIVRGEEGQSKPTPTLQFAHSCGMQLVFVSRTQYQDKEKLAISYLKPNSYLIPEGGSNALAVQGVGEAMTEIIEQLGHQPDYVCVPVGTGATAAGLLSRVGAQTKILAFPVLKAEEAYFQREIRQWIEVEKMNNLLLLNNYHFGGYAKMNQTLIDFIGQFEEQHNLLLEQVYTGKMFFGLYDLMANDFFPKGSTVVVLHTGGLQGRSLLL